MAAQRALYQIHSLPIDLAHSNTVPVSEQWPSARNTTWLPIFQPTMGYKPAGHNHDKFWIINDSWKCGYTSTQCKNKRYKVQKLRPETKHKPLPNYMNTGTKPTLNIFMFLLESIFLCWYRGESFHLQDQINTNSTHITFIRHSMFQNLKLTQRDHNDSYMTDFFFSSIIWSSLYLSWPLCSGSA